MARYQRNNLATIMGHVDKLSPKAMKCALEGLKKLEGDDALSDYVPMWRKRIEGLR